MKYVSILYVCVLQTFQLILALSHKNKMIASKTTHSIDRLLFD